MASVPDPEHVKPWYLRNITEALALDEASGNVYVRTGFTGNIVIEGNVNIPGNIQVYSTPENPVHTHITEVGTSNILDVPYMPIGGDITGNIIVSSGNINANVHGNVGIIGNVNVTQGTSPWVITGDVNANVSGTVVVSSGNVNANVSGNVGILTMPNVNASVTGTVVVSSGNVNANVSGNVGIIGNVNVTQGTSPWVTTGTLTGNVAIGDFPDTAISAFQELLSAPITPLIQSDANYGLDPDVWQETLLNGGNITVADTGLWSVSCTTTTNSYARLYTSRYAKYQPGQGMMARWTCAFTTTGGNSVSTSTGVTNCVQVSGPIDREDGYSFGFSGNATNNKIGIQHRRAGKVEIRQFTVTTYNTGTQNITFTLNGVATQITITASTSNNQAATKIAIELNKTIQAQYWDIDACTGVITMAYYSPGLKNGTFSYVVSGTGTPLAGTFSTLVSGVSQIDKWYYYNEWDNHNITIDPAKLNVYAMDMRWLGAGAVRFFVEEPTTGKMVLVHTLRWTENQTGVYPHTNKPNMRLTYRIGSITGTQPAQAATLSGASIMLATQGIYNQTTMSQGWYNVDSSTRAKDIVWHLMTIQNPFVRSSVLNKSSLVMQDLTVSAQGNDPMIIYIVKNAAATNDVLEFNLVPGHGNPYWFAQYSVTSTYTALGSENINNVQTLGINGSSQFDLMKYNLSLAPGDTFSVFITSTNAINRTSIGITWRVD